MKLDEALFLANTAEHVSQESLAKAAPVLVAEINRLRSALQMIADETMVPDAWEEDWDSWPVHHQLHMSTLLIAGAALDGEPDGASPQECDSP